MNIAHITSKDSPEFKLRNHVIIAKKMIIKIAATMIAATGVVFLLFSISILILDYLNLCLI